MSYFRHFQEMLTSRDLHVIVNYIKHKSEIDNLYWKIVFEIWFIYQDFFQIKSILYKCTCNTVRNRIIITRYRHIGNISHTYVIKRHVFIKCRDTKQNYMYLYVTSTAGRFKILQMRQLRKRTYSNTTMFCNKQIKTISILYFINIYTSFVYIIYKFKTNIIDSWPTYIAVWAIMW